MNRQTKRMLQRQGQLGPDGQPAAPSPRTQRGGGSGRPPGGRPPAGPGGGRRGFRGAGDFFKDVRGELKRVAWPSRAEVINYSSVVLFTLVLLIALIFALDFGFAKAAFFLFDT